MIDRVDINPFEDSPGFAITFHYDNDCEDTFSVFDSGVAGEIMAIISAGLEPERVLIAIRQYGKFQLH